MQFGHYKILSAIGAGGMGEVYLSEDTRLDRKVAVKFLSGEYSKDADKLNRFVQEAKAASALNHPNIITVYEVGESDGTNFIATEFIDGQTLREVISRKPSAALSKLLHISIQVTEALSAAHRAGIVHRDIKPENIMVRPDGYVKVLDFGLAKLTEPKPTGEEGRTLVHSNPGVIRGTVAYMSPEQARGLKVDLRTDIWSFGVLLYEMLARRTPFAGETVTDQMLSIIQKEPPDLRNIAPNLPDELYFIVSKTLRKKKDERYQNISDVLTDLRRVKQRLDYEEIERTLSPEDSKMRIQQEEHHTAILDKQSSDSIESVSISTSTSSETLPPNNLSAELSPMIGREAELAEMLDLLRQPDIRLLTITGVGGTGKTRIAEAIAHDALAEFDQGVFFVNLSAIENPELVVPIIAQTLGVYEEEGKPLKECLREYLSERKILIVVDNFEQITEAAQAVGELLSGSKNLKILVTSRVRLYLRFEHEFPLSPLVVPTDKRLTPAEVGEYPAVKLFVERAKAVKPFFELTEENAKSIAEICRRLDGLPLAIGLAAVRVKLLAPQAILTRLSNRLKLLTGGARDLPERQQTMRGAIAWSYDLLDAEEKILLNRLAVFAGGFTLDAAEAVGNAEGDLQIDLFDGIASLVDKSLLTQREQADGEPRFRMLEVVGEFALEALDTGGEANEIKRRHAEFFAVLSEKAEPEFMNANAAEWFETLEQENDNLRVALKWSLENEPEKSLRIVGAIYRFWEKRGYFAEGGKWTKKALDKNGTDTDPRLRFKASRAAGSLSRKQGNLEAANLINEENLRLSREIGDKSLISLALYSLGSVKVMQGDLEVARMRTEENLAISREIKDESQISNALNLLGEIARMEENYEAARKYYEEAYAAAKKKSVRFLFSIVTFNLAAVAYLQNDYPAARSYTLECLEVSEEMGDKSIIAGVLDIFAALSLADGKPEKTARLCGTAQAVYEAIGYQLETTDQIFNDRYESEARKVIGDEAFDAAFAEGKTMRLKKAIALARETD